MTLLTTGYPEHDRWGTPSESTATRILANLTPRPQAGIIGIRHPEYNKLEVDWQKWRLIMEGGDVFNEEFIRKFSEREGNTDFAARKRITPSPAFAKGALNEIKNSIFQRTADITRAGGPATYLAACEGKLGGVDNCGSTMNSFLGEYVIQELLAMKKVGIFVDSPKYGPTLADKGLKHPYMYRYRAEDILSWNYDSPRELSSVLLRDYRFAVDTETALPREEVTEYRLLKKVPEGVLVRYYNEANQQVGTDTLLRLSKIPLEILELSDSLLKDIANHQIALANLESSDLSFLLKAGFPLYTEQVNDLDYANIRAAQQQSAAATAQATNGQASEGNSLAPYQIIGDVSGLCQTNLSRNGIDVGVSQGRQYSKGLDRPEFIAPSPEVIKASMEKQEELKADIRLLVHLALANLKPLSASAESKEKDDRGLEAGLSAIGLVLEKAERNLAAIWRLYEGSDKAATVIYPKRWSLKSDEDIRKEIEHLEERRDSVPSKTYQKEITKQIASISLGSKISDETLAKINQEVESAPGITSDPDILAQDQKAGVLSDKNYALLRCYDPADIEEARKDRSIKAAAVLKAQTNPTNKGGDPAARGVPELSDNPDASKEEKEDKPVRGEGK